MNLTVITHYQDYINTCSPSYKQGFTKQVGFQQVRGWGWGGGSGGGENTGRGRGEALLLGTEAEKQKVNSGV